MSGKHIAAALERAAEDARQNAPARETDGRARTRRLAIGDPQASIETFFAILDLHGVIGEDGRLRPEVQLVSMGDHFDFGKRADRVRAAQSAERLLAWLAAHPTDQVTLIAGNHDLARVGEMAPFADDAAFEKARAEADAAYREDGSTDPDREKAVLKRWPGVPTAECLARDFSTFRVEQRSRVTALLRSKRFRLAAAAGPNFLLCHAGATRDELEACGVRETRDARACADGLNAAFDAAIAAWKDGPLSIGALHRPGDAAFGEARGMFFHRPSNPDREGPAYFEGPPRRRFDPRRLPAGLTQAIGHIRDNKCRKLLAGWHDGAVADDGPLRILETDSHEVRYRNGTVRTDEHAARIVFTDGGMNVADPARYELLDLDRIAPATRST